MQNRDDLRVANLQMLLFQSLLAQFLVESAAKFAYLYRAKHPLGAYR